MSELFASYLTEAEADRLLRGGLLADSNPSDVGLTNEDDLVRAFVLWPSDLEHDPGRPLLEDEGAEFCSVEHLDIDDSDCALWRALPELVGERDDGIPELFAHGATLTLGRETR